MDLSREGEHVHPSTAAAVTCAVAALGWGCLLGCGGKPQSNRSCAHLSCYRYRHLPRKAFGRGHVMIFRLKDGTYSATGRTDAQGNYKLSTFNPGDGAPAGEYTVAIVALESVPA